MIEAIKSARAFVATACPSCGEALDGHTSESGRLPEPGDLGLCAYCCTVFAFQEGARARVFTDAEIEALPPEDREYLKRSVATLRAMQAVGLLPAKSEPEARS